MFFDDIKKLLRVLDRLVEGGDNGDRVIAFGTPEQVAAQRDSYTGQFLADILPKPSSRRTARSTQVVDTSSRHGAA